ncbi:hypothetical protein [Chryseobacterium sp.]|uniref:hypothetical protein n=1 Tax=Chryseobacterium sp. TaxID=1871047 RepID=UPI0011C9713B|nr:hypothetical protein [Chryseobacterium sp.]TXF74978.1 hypothetical protein FUA25_11895 [Chryseobacterium sp.]
MAKDKYDFIQELLENKKLTLSQRERILRNTKNEIKKDGLLGKDLEQRVAQLEEQVQTTLGGKLGSMTHVMPDKKIDEEMGTPQMGSTKLKYVNPHKLASFLEKFNQNPLLRTACHLIDSNELKMINRACGTLTYDYFNHRQLLIDEFNEWIKGYADGDLKAIFFAFITGRNFDNSKNLNLDSTITINWFSDELESWCRKNPGAVPHPDPGFKNVQKNKGCKLPQPLSGQTFPADKSIYFSDLILYFKKLFHIRGDNPLVQILKTHNTRNNWERDITFIIEEENFPEDIELFTNVQKLIAAYDVLIKLIIEVQKKYKLEKPLVKLSLLQSKKGTVELSVHHKNTTFRKSRFDAINRPGQVLSNLFDLQLNGLCDFYIRAIYADSEEPHIINFWDGKPAKAKPDSVSSFHGVEYILKFTK